ncbi:MAG TPA: YqcC family protein [Phototrophicaceae bacterium]|nr:YqcC family protein [Phototrophicaceae bacterium]
MNSRRVALIIIVALWIVVLAAATIGLQLSITFAVILGALGAIIIAGLFRTPRPRYRGTVMSKTPPNYEAVARQADAIEAEMKRIGFWQDTPLKPEQYDFRAAFAGDTMAFPQWLQFIFLPRVRDIIARRGQFPPSSQVAAYAIREFDTYSQDTSTLHQLLYDFDHLF